MSARSHEYRPRSAARPALAHPIGTLPDPCERTVDRSAGALISARGRGRCHPMDNGPGPPRRGVGTAYSARSHNIHLGK
jgi:hypothetical protein